MNCERCGNCCKTINVKVAILPEHLSSVEDYAKYLTYYDCAVQIKGGFLDVKIPRICKHLTYNEGEGYACQIHNDPNRAEYCSRFFCGKYEGIKHETNKYNNTSKK